MEEFLNGEKCERCGGPLLAEAQKKTTFHEESMDYTVQTFWPCCQCGHLNALDSQPRFVF